MLLMHDELKFPGAGGTGRLAVIYEQCRQRLGLFALLKSGFSWQEARLLWRITAEKYERERQKSAEGGGGR